MDPSRRGGSDASSPSSIDIRDRIARGLHKVWSSQAELIAGSLLEEIDGLLIVLTNVPDPEVNVAFVAQEPEDPLGALERADAMFAQHHQRIGLDLEEGRFPAVEAAAREVGLRPLFSRPGMALDLDRFEAGRPPRGVEIRPVSDAADLAAFVDVQAQVFGWSHEVAARYLADPGASHPIVTYYLGLLEGEPVAAAASYVHANAVGVFGVGTAELVRRRGIGTAMTARAIADARASSDMAFLQASAMGRSTYERMGFRRVSDWVVWARPE